MISPDHVRQMAAYNRWQNRSLYREADALDAAARRADRGAFFGSIHGTLGHLLWGDMMWMSRLDGWERPAAGPADGERWMDWEELKAARAGADERILGWARRQTAESLAGDLVWHSGLQKAEQRKPRWLAVAHFFNHQTHHRGQVHALLTGFGRRPDPTDLIFMPEAEAAAP